MKHILLPTDFSKNAYNAIAYAVQLYRDVECKFYILHTYTPANISSGSMVDSHSALALQDIIIDTAKRKLKEIEDRLHTEFSTANHTFIAMASFNLLISQIKDAIKENAIDLVIMGTKGASGAKEIVFGSNAVKVFKEIKHPVLAIPSDFEYEAPHEILFPTDLEAMYKHSNLNILKKLAISNHARVNLMHVSTGYDLTEQQETNKRTLESIFKNSTFLFHDIKNMGITEAINEFQVKHKINLLVMINNKHSFFENLFFKNRINQIGFHSNIPFLVIPSEDQIHW